MKRVLLIYLLICSLHSQEYQYSENLVETLQRADHLFRQNQIGEALIEYENSLLLDGGNQKGLGGIFQCQLKLGKLDEARKSLEAFGQYSLDSKILQQYRDQLEEAETVQDQLAAQKFFDQQVEEFEAVNKPIRRMPDAKKTIPAGQFHKNTPQGKFARAIQLHRKGFSSQAIPIYIESIMDEPNLLFANDDGLMELARTFYISSHSADPRNLKTMFILAWIWEQYSNDEKAIGLYEEIKKQAVKGSPEEAVATNKIKEFQALEQQKLEREAEERNRLEKDQERFRRLQIANGQFSAYSPEDYQEKGLAYLEQKNITEAIIHLQGAVRVSPTDPKAHYHYAMAQVESAFAGNENGFSIAKRELETTLSLDPEPLLRRKASNLLSTLTNKENSNQSTSPTSNAP